MFKDNEGFLDATRSVARSVVARCCPNESPLFSTLWNRAVESGILHLSAAEMAARLKSRPKPWALGFDQARKAGISSHLILLTVATILKEIDGAARMPSLEELKQAVMACANVFHTPKPLTLTLTETVPTFLQSLAMQYLEGSKEVQSSQRQHIEVNSDGTVRVNACEFRISPAYSSLLFCELVRAGCVHWARGFVLFRTWRKSRPQKPYDNFQSLVSQIRSALRHNDAHLSIEARKEHGERNTGYWFLTPNEDVELAGEIVEAKRFLVEAGEHMNRGRREAALLAVGRALELDSMNHHALFIMADVLDACHTLPNWQKVIRSGANQLVVLDHSLEDAIEGLCSLAQTAEHQTENLGTFLEYLQAELTCAKRAMVRVEEFVHKNRLLTDDDVTMRILDACARSLDKSKRRAWAIKTLEKNPHVAEVVRAVQAMCRKLLGGVLEMRMKDYLRNTIWTALVSGKCLRSRDVFAYQNLPDLKRCWKCYIFRETVELIIEEFSSVSSTDQKKVRRLLSAEAKFQGEGPVTSEADLCAFLQWDKAELMEVQELRRRMFSQSISLDGEGLQVDAEKYHTLWAEAGLFIDNGDLRTQ